MATIVNFNKARKKKMRELAPRTAAENRARFGRTPAERARDEAAAEEARRELDLIKTDPQA